MSLATTFTSTKILELISNLQTSVEATYLKKNIAPGVPADYVPVAAGDGTWAWAAPAAGGSDGFGGTTVATPSTQSESTSGSGKKLYLADWTFDPYKTGQPGPSLVDHPSSGAGGFGFAVAGWYSITANINLQFTGTTLPDHVRFELMEFNVIDGFIHDLACTPGETDTGNKRSDHGVQATVQSHIFYQEGDAVTGSMVIKPFIYWSTDAVASTKLVDLYITKHG